MFRLLFFVFSLPFGIYAFCLSGRILRQFSPGMNRALSAAFRIATALLTVKICGSLRNTSAMVLLHILIFSMLCDLFAVLARIVLKKMGYRCTEAAKKLYRSGCIPLAAALLLLGYGYINMKHVVRTEYQIDTEKQIGEYKAVFLSDTHFGTIQDPDILRDKVAQINLEEPDFVILCGDIVEEGTTKEDMEECFRILGGLRTKYGIYYVYGNHDRQSYSREPAYSGEELAGTIEKNGITILEDSLAEINGEIILAGREDAGGRNTSGRASAEELLAGADREKYIIMADHQPLQAEENNARGVDLQVSGHTHNGQIWPVGLITRLMGDLTYGKYQIGDCTVIVSSGFTGWGYPIRTEGHCEYVVLRIGGNLNGEGNLAYPYR